MSYTAYKQKIAKELLENLAYISIRLQCSIDPNQEIKDSPDQVQFQ